jgi:hypothetical protein
MVCNCIVVCVEMKDSGTEGTIEMRGLQKLEVSVGFWTEGQWEKWTRVASWFVLVSE